MKQGTCLAGLKSAGEFIPSLISVELQRKECMDPYCHCPHTTLNIGMTPRYFLHTKHRNQFRSSCGVGGDNVSVINRSSRNETKNPAECPTHILHRRCRYTVALTSTAPARDVHAAKVHSLVRRYKEAPLPQRRHKVKSQRV